MSEADQQWGARLKQARLAVGLSQKMLGIEAGIDEFVASTRINRYELGVHKPDLLIARKLAKVLDVPVAFFYTDTDDELALLLVRYWQADSATRAKVLALLEASAPPDCKSQEGSESKQGRARKKADIPKADRSPSQRPARSAHSRKAKP